MNSSQTYHALNRLLSILQRSFPMYLRGVPPLAAEADSQAVDVLNQIAEDQTTLSRRITALILFSDDQPDAGDFPMEFTDMHDLTIDFILRRTIGYQCQDVASIQQSIDSLQLAPAALALAEEALELSKAQLESLEALVQGKASSAAGR